jgi:predicted DNA-binding protein
MTAIIPRRLFDDMPDDQTQHPPTKEAELKANGMIRSSLVIPIEHNERLKAMARKLGKNTDQLIGEMHMQFVAPNVDRWEAQQEVARLRERFGDDWLSLLQQSA